MSEPIVLLKGGDPVLLAEAAGERLAELVGERDRDEVVDVFSGDDYALSDAVMAASAVSMFGERVVVARNASRFGVGELGPLLNYAADPNPTSHLLVVWDKPTRAGLHAHPVPKKLADAVKACGGTVRDCDVGPNRKARDGWWDDHLSAARVRLAPPARHLLRDRLGEDLGRLGGVLRLLDSTFPAGAELGADDIEPFLGEAGAVPPWELTDAIDRGDVPGAVAQLRRMIGPGGRHPLQVMVTLCTHVQRMLRLDGAGVRTEAEAAELLGIKGSTYPAKKALEQSRRLGSERIARAVTLLAGADVDLRGASGLPPEAVMEVLVGRLAGLARRR